MKGEDLEKILLKLTLNIWNRAVFAILEAIGSSIFLWNSNFFVVLARNISGVSVCKNVPDLEYFPNKLYCFIFGTNFCQIFAPFGQVSNDKNPLNLRFLT